MKVNISYDLPEEIENLKYAIYGYKYESAIQDFDNELRNHLKYDNYKEWDTKTVESIRDLLYEICDTKDVDILGG